MSKARLGHGVGIQSEIGFPDKLAYLSIYDASTDEVFLENYKIKCGKTLYFSRDQPLKIYKQKERERLSRTTSA